MKILSGLAEGQVLQRLGSRGALVYIAGATPGEGPVTATISSKTGALKNWKRKVVGKAVQGKFSFSLPGIPAGGPYQLELNCGKASVKIREFFVGDVWVLSGQSNMQGCGNMAGAARPHPMVRAFSMRREWRKAVEPITLLLDSPDFCHNGGAQATVQESELVRKTISKGVGPGLPFGEEMWKRTAVPQGLICVAHGGTSMAQWSPQRLIDGKISLYGSMLDSVRATGQPVAGVLWYQGESDANATAVPLYTGRMQQLVKTFRKDIKQASVPWVVVQIARVFREETPETESHWNSIQEQQRLLPGVVKNLGVVAAVDLSLDDNIHISAEGHRRLGLRLAREADRLAHGNRREKAPPSLRLIGQPGISKNVPLLPSLVAEVVFDGVEGSLQSKGEPSGFALVDGDGKVLRTIFKTTLHGNVARLHLSSGFLDAQLCYGKGTTTTCNITDERDHALPVFTARPLGKPRAFLPFIKKWRVTSPMEVSKPLDKMAAPDFSNLKSEVKVYGNNDFNLEGFVNEHPQWTGHHGHGYFEAILDLSESMRLEALMGYDGPFRMWFDRKPFFVDLNGSNPCFADQSSKGITLTQGRHSIQVAMDINRGSAWGFFLRFYRKDVAVGDIKSGDFARPVYGV